MCLWIYRFITCQALMGWSTYSDPLPLAQNRGGPKVLFTAGFLPILNNFMSSGRREDRRGIGILPMIFIGRKKNLVEKDKEQIEPAPRIEVMIWDGRRRPSQYFWKDGIGLCFLVFWVRCTPKGIIKTALPRASSLCQKSAKSLLYCCLVKVRGCQEWDRSFTVRSLKGIQYRTWPLGKGTRRGKEKLLCKDNNERLPLAVQWVVLRQQSRQSSQR